MASSAWPSNHKKGVIFGIRSAPSLRIRNLGICVRCLRPGDPSRLRTCSHKLEKPEFPVLNAWPHSPRCVRRVGYEFAKLRDGLHFHRQHSRKIAHDGIPAISGIGRRIDLSAGGSEVDSAFVEGVDRHGVAQNVYVTVLLRETLGERFPLVSTRTAAEYTELALVYVVLRVALDGNNVNGLGLPRMHVDHKAKISGQI